MIFLMEKNWWHLVLRGIIAILVGVVTFLWPGLTLSTLVLLFGIYALVDGVTNLIGMFRGSAGHERWMSHLLQGVAGIVAGLFTLLFPIITALALVYVIAGWALVTGVLQIVTAIRLRKEIHGEWILLLSGVLSIVLGVLFAIAPLAAGLAIALWFGTYALIFGALMIGLGLRLRSRGHHTLTSGTSMPLPT